MRRRRIGRRLLAGALALSAMGACGAKRPGAVATVPAVRALPCHGSAGLVAWKPDGQPDQPMLDRWCASVGAPVIEVVDHPPAQIRRHAA